MQFRPSPLLYILYNVHILYSVTLIKKIYTVYKQDVNFKGKCLKHTNGNYVAGVNANLYDREKCFIQCYFDLTTHKNPELGFQLKKKHDSDA
jgi:hypothetical protein